MRPFSRGMGIQLKTRNRAITPSGMETLDDLLQGGFRRDSIIHLYGQPGSGKTTFAMQYIRNVLQRGWRGIWIDCNGAFSLTRFIQILQDIKLLRAFTLARTVSFQHQTQVIQQLQDHVDRVGIVIVDPITHFYRAERYDAGSLGFFNELIGTQLSILAGIAHLQKIPVIVINYATTISHPKHKGYKIRAPLTASGFKRVERYRLAFINGYEVKEGDEGRVHHYITIEKSPEPSSRYYDIPLFINARGVELGSPVYNKEEKELQEELHYGTV